MNVRRFASSREAHERWKIHGGSNVQEGFASEPEGFVFREYR
jgi:hypothetical protein